MRISTVAVLCTFVVVACSSSSGGPANGPTGGSGNSSQSGSGGGSGAGGSGTSTTTPGSGSTSSGEPTSSSGGSGTSSSSGSSSGSANPDDGGTITPPDDAATFSTDASLSACGSTKLLAVPDDPSARGPWDVGVRTATVGRLTVEVFYPAQPGSTTGVAEVTYDLRQWLPKDQQAKVPNMYATPLAPIGGHLFRGVPIDSNYGPYPVVVAIHGTASMRVASISAYSQWASRGFVVASADYPGIVLTDELCATADCASASKSCGTVGKQDITGDVTTQITALTTPTADLAFLMGHIDMTRIGITGHSQGACVAASLSGDPNVEIVMPMAGSLNVVTSSTLKSLIYIAGMADTVIGYSSDKIGNFVCVPASGQKGATSDTGAYTASPGPPVTKRLVGITGGGHLVVTDLCQDNSRMNNAIQEAKADSVCGIGTAVDGIGLTTLFDCGTAKLADGVKAVNYASTAALEETLHCQNRSSQFTNLKTALPVVGDFQHMP